MLQLVGQGMDNHEVGYRRLVISPRTVEKHVERLLARTGLTGRASLMAFAARADPTDHAVSARPPFRWPARARVLVPAAPGRKGGGITVSAPGSFPLTAREGAQMILRNPGVAGKHSSPPGCTPRPG